MIPALLLALAVAPATAQTGVLDQVSPLNLNGMPLQAGTGSTWQQQVAVGVSGVLEGVTLRVASPVAADTATVNLYSGPGPHGPGVTPLASSQVVANSATPTDDFVDLQAAGLVVHPGDKFCVEIVADAQAMTLVFNSAFFAPLYPEPAFVQPPGGGPYSPVAIERIGFESYVLAGPLLEIVGSCPGPLLLKASNMTPTGLVGFGASLGSGTSVVPNGACAGTLTQLAQPRVVALLHADGQGVAQFSGAVPPQLGCGLLTVQALDVATCVTTNTVGT